MTIYVPDSHVPPEGRYGAPRQAGGVGIGYGHRGVDHHAPEGTPIYALGAGRFMSGGRSSDTTVGSYGWWKLYDFGDHRTLIAHLLDGRGPTGDVEAGDLIGYVGRSGNARFGPPHVHEEARHRGAVIVDPAPFYTQFAGSIGVPILTEKEKETMQTIYMKVKGAPDQAILQPITYAFPNPGELKHSENLYPRVRTVVVDSLAAFDTIMKMHGRPVPRRKG